MLAFATLTVSQLIGVLENYINAWISQRVIFDMKNQMFDHLQHMPHAFFTSEKQGDIITRMNTDISGVSTVISSTLASIVSNVATVAFGFQGERVMTPVGVLSGGERSRLKLCMLMGSDINLLILDEPTNHLDIASREWMEDALSDYEQTLVFVSHDRYFIDKFATRILFFNEDGTVTDYRGGYRDFSAWRERQQRRNASFAVNPVNEIPGIEEELGLKKHYRRKTEDRGKGGSK